MGNVPHYQDEALITYNGDCRDVMPHLKPVDAVVTDPPYGLGFMGKKWDTPGSFVERPADRSQNWDHVGGNHNPTDSKDSARTRRAEARKFQAWCDTWASSCLDAMKPGAHLLAFGGTRTHHRLMCAIEDAGFEIRDCVMWVYGSGFPKSHDVSKAIDKAAGAEREIVGRKTGRGASPVADIRGGKFIGGKAGAIDCSAITAPATEAAKQWDGWGTALKPAWEPIILARKALEGTVAENILKYGTGALNIDDCRVQTEGRPSLVHDAKETQHNTYGRGLSGSKSVGVTTEGRWPANLIHDGSDEVLSLFPETSSGAMKRKVEAYEGESVTGFLRGESGPNNQHGDSGSAARFFYCAKASGTDRGNETLAALPLFDIPEETFVNDHPTVKPIELMKYLLRLVVPAGGVVLDPFMGSGSTLVAAKALGVRAIGIDEDEQACEIATRRLEALGSGAVIACFESRD